MQATQLSLSVFLLMGVLFATAVNVIAGPVKSVDEHGNVTYSDKPVPGATEVSKVPITAGPSETEVEAAKQQADKNINAAKKIDKKNKAALEKQQAAKKKSQVSSEQKQTGTGINTPTGNYNSADPYYYRPHKPRPPIQLPRPPGTKPPVNLPAPRPGRR